MSKVYALVRIDNGKFNERYSEPIIKADTLEEMEMKITSKTATKITPSDDVGAGLGEFDLEGWL